ncbi:MAG: hypothetical protein FJ100_22930, partial [Deltaproteobacteria bacterium]|nr:hypothetical protein [Deltaproteobacteria bacterium]
VPLWTVLPQPDLRFWLRVDPAVAMRRLEMRLERRTADEHVTGLQGYARVFDDLAKGDTEYTLDAADSMDAISSRIASAVLARLQLPPDRDVATHAERSNAPIAATSRPVLEVAAVRLDGAARGPVPGADLLALRRALVRFGGDPLAMPAAWWVEAWLAQVVLDFRSGWQATAGGAVRLPIWPAALAAMPEMADVPMLPELLRMLPVLQFVGPACHFGPAADAVFALFACGTAGLQRARAAYLRAFSRVTHSLDP